MYICSCKIVLPIDSKGENLLIHFRQTEKFVKLNELISLQNKERVFALFGQIQIAIHNIVKRFKHQSPYLHVSVLDTR